jgi:pyruvate kinase
VNTKIIASLGPASCDLNTVINLCKEGVSGFRINFAHGNEELWKSMVENVLRAESICSKPLAIIGDLRGPSIRLGELNGQIAVKKGETIKLVLSERSEGRELPLPVKEVYEQLEVGDLIIMSDGKFRFRVSEIGEFVELTALTDALISSRNTIAVANKEFDLPLLREKDLADIEFAVKNKFSYIGLSYVRGPSDLEMLRKVIKKSGGERTKIIAKIETKSAVKNLDEIVELCDAVLVARGDLGMNFGLEEIPYLQRKIIKRSIEIGKPVILATQLLESMIENPIPTRAEVVDISTATSEGVDALMLTGETAIGKHPVEAVRWLRKIIETTERKLTINKFRDVKGLNERFAKGVVELAEDINSKLVVFSKFGNTPRRMALLRPAVEFYVGTPDIEVARTLSILWGIKAYEISALDYDEGLEKTYEFLKKRGELRFGDLVIMAYGLKEQEQAIKLRRVS